MFNAYEPIMMEFPLRGEWLLPNTPGASVPSHGTNRFGSRYAYDFIKVDWHRKGYPAYKGNPLKYMTTGMPIDQYYCWGEPVYAPCNGVVVKKSDHYCERNRTQLFKDMVRAYINSHYFNPFRDDIKKIAGNYVIIRFKEHIYAALVHLQNGSICVSEGDAVKKGDLIGRIGHSGNSYMPHLHFQLMDSTNITNAIGLHCAFEKYEVFIDGLWQTKINSIPTNKERIRFIGKH